MYVFQRTQITERMKNPETNNATGDSRGQMYSSEILKTLWTKIGQMCGYITCAKSYLSGSLLIDFRVFESSN